MSGNELTARIRAGDESAFEELFQTWYAPLVRLATGILRSKALAEEVVQDVMLEFWRGRERLRPEGTPQAYLMQSTRNRAFNVIRHDRVHSAAAPLILLDGPSEAVPIDSTVHDELDSALKEAVASMGERTREIFELSRTHGLKYAEIAETMKISIKTVEAHMGRALQLLRERLAPWLDDSDQ